MPIQRLREFIAKSRKSIQQSVLQQFIKLFKSFLTYLAFAATADGKKVYVDDSVYNIVSVIDTATNTVIATIPVGIFPYGVTVTPDGKKVYVTNRKGKIVGFVNRNTVSVIDTSTKSLSEKSVMHVEKSQSVYNIRVFAPVLYIAYCNSYSRQPLFG
jgi:YVTN family beta-propeller protein